MKVEVVTKYNVIHLTIESKEDEDFKLLLEQPYVIEVKYIEEEKSLTLSK
jgi:hypothetical protein